MSTSAVTESSLDILSRAAVAAGIMAKRFKDENAPPTPPSPVEEKADSSGDEKTAEKDGGTRTETKKSTTENSDEPEVVSRSVPSVVRRSIIAYAEADSPIDMSLKKSKRKWNSTDLDGCQDDEELVHKRKRPSVITCINRKLCISCDSIDVDDHFRRSLGLESYNWIFNKAKKMLPTGTGDSEGGKVMVEKKNKEVIKSTGSAKRGKKNEIPASLKVDEHFAKSLGKSTWMRLQGH